MAETLVLRGTLEGHEGWVTSIATPQNLNSDVIISASRDKTLLVWKITREEGNYGYPLRSLHGHSHFVEVRPRPADQRARPNDEGPVALSAPGFPDAARGRWRRLRTSSVPWAPCRHSSWRRHAPEEAVPPSIPSPPRRSSARPPSCRSSAARATRTSASAAPPSARSLG